MLPTDRVRTSPAPCTTTALQENEYEIHNRHAFAHDVCHNRCGCAGWKRAGSSAFADHRHATADNLITDYSVVTNDYAAQAISVNERGIDAGSVRALALGAAMRSVVARDRRADPALCAALSYVACGLPTTVGCPLALSISAGSHPSQ